jgi:glycerol kinase
MKVEEEMTALTMTGNGVAIAETGGCKRMEKRYVLAIDQGTTSTRSVLFDRQGRVVAAAQREITQSYPAPGWVEHDPEEIWESASRTMEEALRQAGARPEDVAAIGIANQRETVIVWDRHSGKAVYPAIVWQSRQTAPLCDALRERGLEAAIREKTGLVVDAYFSATKVQWILDRVQGARALAGNGRLALGTVDAWLVWKLTGGTVHATDVSNASRTMLFNIHTLRWDEELLEWLDIPPSMLPDVVDSSGATGYAQTGIWRHARVPVAGIAGDQQAALYGQCCFEKGMAKNTYGTGCFLLMNTGDQPVRSGHGLLTTIAWKRGDAVRYALEGSVFIAGAAIQWLRDGLQILPDAAESEALARSVPSNEGVYFVPAFVGLGTPYWDPNARGLIMGLTRGTDRRHIVRAALEAIAYQTRDLIEAMERDAGESLHMLRVDGGAVKNRFLMQFQADLLGVPVQRLATNEATALGAAYLAGLGAGFWKDEQELASLTQPDAEFRPGVGEETRNAWYAGWNDAVRRALSSEPPR